jgi:hypothetical protein
VLQKIAPTLRNGINTSANFDPHFLKPDLSPFSIHFNNVCDRTGESQTSGTKYQNRDIYISVMHTISQHTDTNSIFYTTKLSKLYKAERHSCKTKTF